VWFGVTRKPQQFGTGTAHKDAGRSLWRSTPSTWVTTNGLASDYLKTNPGFIGAFEVMDAKANPDINAFSFK